MLDLYVGPTVSSKMRLSVVTFCAVACAEEGAWKEWKAQHGKTYDDEHIEDVARLSFEQNLKFYAMRNMNEPTANYGPDRYADMRLSDFHKECFQPYSTGSFTVPTEEEDRKIQSVIKTSPALDYRDKVRSGYQTMVTLRPW